jgi:hypothetical protein
VVRQRFVGFYWTLPIPAVGFTSLPKDVGAAAAASKTIRYQRERIRRWVADQKGSWSRNMLSSNSSQIEAAPMSLTNSIRL